MSKHQEQLIVAKNKIVVELQENKKVYWSYLKAWFKQRLSKEEFDSEARRLLPKQKAHLHNEFVLAILTKCQFPSTSNSSRDSTSSQTSNKIKKSKRLQAIKRKYDHRFTVNQPHPSPPPALRMVQERRDSVTASQPVIMCCKSLLIPSVEEMRNYISVIAWEMGLDDATDDVVAYMTEAVRVFLKNILSASFSRRSAYKSVNKSFKYAMGCEPENPYLKRKKSIFSTRLSVSSEASHDTKEQIKIEDLGRVAQSTFKNKTPLNLYDLFHTIKVFGPSLIPSHTVLALTSERILANLWHPDPNELEQDEIIKRLMHRVQ